MTSKIKLEQLEPVPLREAWPDEAQDFTPWVASEEGLKLIGETSGLELEQLSSSSEVPVGDFRADVVCVDTNEPDSSIVLIENQLEPTNHSHIGQVLTYAAGLNAVTIVWVASEFREAHTAAVHWLNEITQERYRFFALEIRLVKIRDSGPAATFTVVAKPNDWTRSVRARANSGGLTDVQRSHQAFWTEFVNSTKFQNRTPRPEAWFGVEIGTQHANLAGIRRLRPRGLRVELLLKGDRNRGYFAALQDEQDKIEGELGVSVEFRAGPSNSRIEVIVDKDPLDESDWPAQIEWFRDTLGKFDRVFRHRVREIDPEEWM